MISYTLVWLLLIFIGILLVAIGLNNEYWSGVEIIGVGILIGCVAYGACAVYSFEPHYQDLNKPNISQVETNK